MKRTDISVIHACACGAKRLDSLARAAALRFFHRLRVGEGRPLHNSIFGRSGML